MVDPGIRRLHVLLKLYQLPLSLAQDILELEELVGHVPPTGTPDALYKEAVEHWNQGNVRKALANVFALRSRPSADTEERYGRQRALLSFAVFAGGLGKTRLSQQIVDDLLVEPPDQRLLVRVLLQQAVCWHWRGSSHAALAFLAHTETLLAERDHKQLGWVRNEQATVFVSMGQFEEAETALQSALREYALANATYDESRALAVRVRLRLAQGDPGAAYEAACTASEHAVLHHYPRLRILRRIDEGRALLMLGRTDDALVALSDALGGAVGSGDPYALFHSHFYLWKLYGMIGDTERAMLELQAAQHFVRFASEHESETVEVNENLTFKNSPRRVRQTTRRRSRATSPGPARVTGHRQ